MIHVQPAAARRQAFARWATRQRPKIRTTGPGTFAVPAALFTAAPEAVLIGSTVDGQRYVSPQTSPPRPAKAPTRRRPGTTKPSPKRPARVSPRPDAGTMTPAGVEGAPAGVTPPGGGPARGDGPPPGPPDSVSAPTSPAPGADTDTTPATATSQPDDSAGDGADSWDCPACPRAFTTARGRAAHHRQAHAPRED